LRLCFWAAKPKPEKPAPAREAKTEVVEEEKK